MQITLLYMKPSSQEEAYFGDRIWNLKEKRGIKFSDFIETEKFVFNHSHDKRVPRKEGHDNGCSVQ